MAGDPGIPSNGRYVPMNLYLEDRRELRAWMADLATDVKAMRRELDRDDGEQGVRKTRAERVWDLVRTTFAAAVGAVATLITVYVSGG